MTAARVRALSFHAGYACRSTAACCTAPWRISIDDRRAARLDDAASSGQLRLPGGDARAWRDDDVLSDRGPQGGEGALLATTQAGACVFLGAGPTHLCAIHRDCGHDALPEACQQFPRVTLADDRGLHVTLSHYCPTVTAMTVAATNSPVSIVAVPASFARAPLVAGLDARGEWPPLLRPGVLCAHDAWSAWEAWVVDQFGNAAREPWSTLVHVSRAADAARAWRASDGAQGEFLARTLTDSPAAAAPGLLGFDPAVEWTHAWRSVPAERATAPLVDVASSEWRMAIDQAVDIAATNARAVNRYLAARAFANWCAYQGRGLRSHVASVRMSLGVLLGELARAIRNAGSPHGDGLEERPRGEVPLTSALRRSDWLLLHLAESASVARRCSVAE